MSRRLTNAVLLRVEARRTISRLRIMPGDDNVARAGAREALSGTAAKSDDNMSHDKGKRPLCDCGQYSMQTY